MDKKQLANYANRILAKNPVFLDTETTGLGCSDEIVELSVIDARGDVLIDTLIKPVQPISPDAEAIHGISNEMVRNAPAFAQVWPSLYPL